MKKNTLLFVGDTLVENRPFYHYILRQTSQSIAQIDTILQINANRFLTTLEKLLNEDLNLIIFTTQQNFSTVSKVIATFLGDKLELKSNMLIPQKTRLYEDDSFLIELESSVINVVKASQLQQLPPILVQQNENIILHIFDLDKESIEILIEPLTKSFEVELSYSYLTNNWIKLNCKSKKHGDINHFISSAKKLFSGKAIDSKNIFKYLINKLKNEQKTITFAESCTGGLIASKFTAQSGASAVIQGSSVTYSNTIKNEWLGVDDKVFVKDGAVSKECAQQMCIGALEIAKADFSIAVSGIAGPTGGTEYKPVGTVVIGIGIKESENIKTVVKEFHFKGDRNYIQDQTLYSAINLLINSDKKLFL